MSRHIKQEIIHTKSPVDIVDAVNSKYNEIKCASNLKHETFFKLSKIYKLYKQWKERYEWLDLIETRLFDRIH